MENIENIKKTIKYTKQRLPCIMNHFQLMLKYVLSGQSLFFSNCFNLIGQLL